MTPSNSSASKSGSLRSRNKTCQMPLSSLASASAPPEASCMDPPKGPQLRMNCARTALLALATSTPPSDELTAAAIVMLSFQSGEIRTRLVGDETFLVSANLSHTVRPKIKWENLAEPNRAPEKTLKSASSNCSCISPGTRHGVCNHAWVMTQLIPHSAHGMNEPGMKTVIHFTSQVIHIDINNIGGGIEREIPHVLNDHGPGDAAPRVAHQILEQCEFLGCQFNAPPRPFHTPLHTVEL